MEFRCTVDPHYKDPAFQHVTITALSNEEEMHFRGDESHSSDRPKESDIPNGTILGSAAFFRYYDPEFHPENFPQYVWEVMDSESGDLEAVASLINLYGHLVKYQNEDQEYDFSERCSGLLVIDRIQVAPFARKHGIGAMILKEIRHHHAGQLFYCALTAEPYDLEVGPERKAMQKRLISWYKRQKDMYFQSLSPRKNPEFLMAVWDGRDMNYAFADIDDISSLAESWKASQANTPAI